MRKLFWLGFFLLFFNEQLAAKPLLFGVICALPTESAQILKYIENVHPIVVHGMTYYQGNIGNKDVITVVSGYRSVNAAIVTTMLIEQFNPNYLLFFGSAGRVPSDLHIGDVVASHFMYQLNRNKPFRYATTGRRCFPPHLVKGVPEPLYLVSDQQLLTTVNQIKNDVVLHASLTDTRANTVAKIVPGNMATADYFIHNGVHHLPQMQQNQIIAVSMEGFGFMKSCWFFDKPCLVVRGISDAIINPDNNPNLNLDNKNRSLAEYNAAQVVAKIIEKFDSRS